eukprot:gene12964-13065_t
MARQRSQTVGRVRRTARVAARREFLRLFHVIPIATYCVFFNTPDDRSSNL